MSNISIKKIGVTKLDVDAIVNAANSGLWEGGGVCGAIFRDAGSKELTEACDKYGHCDVGKAVITPGFKLKAKYIIHSVGPQWIDGNHGEPVQLYDAYKNSLELAKENGCHSIGFPLISTGIFGYPKDKAWRKAIRACVNFINRNPDYDMDITFAILDDQILTMGQNIMEGIVEETGVDLGEKDKYADVLTTDLDQKFTAFCNNLLPLLKAIVSDDELKSWFENYNGWSGPTEHKGLFSLIDQVFFHRAYDDGLIITQYRNIICDTGIDENMIFRPTKEWVEDLSKLQIIACVAYHFRADHFSEGSLYGRTLAKGLLIPYMEAYLNSK